jgi:hypothetical protein
MPLPDWTVERIEIHLDPHNEFSFRKVLLVTCPRTGCGGQFLIPLSWKRKNTYGTAPCPICFKTNRIPNYR